MRRGLPDWIDRTLRQVCPACGEGRLFSGVLAMVPECSSCGLDFMGDDGAQYGGAAVLAYGIGGIAGLLTLALLLRTGGRLTGLAIWATAAVAVLAILGSYRFCKALWTWILYRSGELGPSREGPAAT